MDLNFEKMNGLIPAIIQDNSTSKVLMVSTQLKKGREEGLKEGIEKGLKEGLEQGRKEECFKNAKKMKQAGIAFDVIAQVTGLSIGEIASL